MILLHSSKTMVPTSSMPVLHEPLFSRQAQELAAYIRSLSRKDIERTMHVSPALARQVEDTFAQWRAGADTQAAAVETFRGDIYSGLRALDFTPAEKTFAEDHLRILSGLYGVLRPYDAVSPYRLEAGYRLPDVRYKNLYDFWGERIGKVLASETHIVNLASAEYEKLFLPYVQPHQQLVKPTFLTRRATGAEPAFVVVHAKIARGAFARWLIRSQSHLPNLQDFNDLGYVYDTVRSKPDSPVYVCEDFRGIGLSQRLV